MSACASGDRNSHHAMRQHQLPRNAIDPLRNCADTPIKQTTPLKQGNSNTPSSSFSSATDTETNRHSDSTVRTTPLRPYPPPHNGTFRYDDSVTGYLQLLQRIDVPAQCAEYFAHLAQIIGSISTGLVPSVTGHFRINNTYFTDVCRTLLRNITSPLERVNEQLVQIARLKSLVLFQAVPTDQVIWACYRQRSQLIIRLLALPSITERDLVHKVARLYSVIIYTPVQLLIDQNRIETSTQLLLNKLYDTFFTWLEQYRNWCRAMKDLADNYMRPLTRRIFQSSSVMAEIERFHRDACDAQAAIDGPNVGVLHLLDDERVLKALNLSARRRNVVVTNAFHNRSRREKTI